MARKPRLEFAGAIYHVFNRGRESETLFGTAEAAQHFVDCLLAGADRMHWRIHAYSLLKNGYHLAIETPRGNLVKGVHWLQSSFGNGLQGSAGEKRHAFQGRYRAVLVEPGAALGQIVDYVHLAPVMEGVVALEHLPQFRWSSLRAFARGKEGRPASLSAEAWLASIGGWQDSEEAWSAYFDHLSWLMSSEAHREQSGFDRLGRGWAHGSEEFRRVHSQHFRRSAAERGWGDEEWVEVNRLEWERHLDLGAKLLGRSLAGASAEAKSAGWKIALAAWMKGRTSVSNRWLGERLHMGPPDAVSRYAGELRDGLRPTADPHFARLTASAAAG